MCTAVQCSPRGEYFRSPVPDAALMEYFQAPVPAAALLQNTVEQFEKVIDLERNLLRKSILKLEHDLNEVDTELDMKEEELLAWEEKLQRVQQDNEKKVQLAKNRIEGTKYQQKSQSRRGAASARYACSLGLIAEGNEDSGDGEEKQTDCRSGGEEEEEGGGQREASPASSTLPSARRGRSPSLVAAVETINALADICVKETGLLREQWRALEAGARDQQLHLQGEAFQQAQEASYPSEAQHESPELQRAEVDSEELPPDEASDGAVGEQVMTVEMLHQLQNQVVDTDVLQQDEQLLLPPAPAVADAIAEWVNRQTQDGPVPPELAEAAAAWLGQQPAEGPGALPAPPEAAEAAVGQPCQDPSAAVGGQPPMNVRLGAPPAGAVPPQELMGVARANSGGVALQGPMVGAPPPPRVMLPQAYPGGQPVLPPQMGGLVTMRPPMANGVHATAGHVLWPVNAAIATGRAVWPPPQACFRVGQH